MRLWRISNFADLSGEGGLLIDGRWHFQGSPVVYCTDHPSTALLEILVHATRHTVPDHYQLLEIEIPDDVDAFVPDVPTDWKDDMDQTRRIGDKFLTERNFALMSVPSVIMPKARNFLLNPKHPDAARIHIVETYRYPFDSRLVR
ncbi:MAG: RES family NAD+ phosphorylase [Mesorhizobium sp.]|nr:RES family NAD+ phosphorylase [Mesorhizobium sp.]MBL8579421.1 RES family NAD+ phosphorylase [Mesorhizobium sp.]